MLEDDLVDAVWRNDLVVVQRLLSAGADPNAPGRAWSSAIACAGENDETGAIIRALVAAGANVKLPDEQGSTPLHFAVDVAIDGAIQYEREVIDWSVVGILLDLGADLSLAHARDETVFDLASAYGYNARTSFEAFLRQRQRSFPQ